MKKKISWSRRFFWLSDMFWYYERNIFSSMPIHHSSPFQNADSHTADLRIYKRDLEQALSEIWDTSEWSRSINILFGKVLSRINSLISQKILWDDTGKFWEFESFMDTYIHWNEPSPSDRIRYLISIVHLALDTIEIPNLEEAPSL